MSTVCSTFAGKLTYYIPEGSGTSGVPPMPIMISTISGSPGFSPQDLNLGVCLGIQIEQQVAAQFANAFDSNIYVVPFGDRAGRVIISFLLNPKHSCASDNSLSADAVSPWQGMANFYKANRLVPANSGPVIVSIGQLAFYGFVTSLSMSARSDQNVLLHGNLIMTAWFQ